MDTAVSSSEFWPSVPRDLRTFQEGSHPVVEVLLRVTLRSPMADSPFETSKPSGSSVRHTWEIAILCAPACIIPSIAAC
jgi:hypothetical protein